MKSLVVDDDVVVTDLGREQAMKLGFELIREVDFWIFVRADFC